MQIFDSRIYIYFSMPKFTEEHLLRYLTDEILIQYFQTEQFFYEWALLIAKKPDRAKKLTKYLRTTFKSRTSLREKINERYFLMHE